MMKAANYEIIFGDEGIDGSLPLPHPRCGILTVHAHTATTTMMIILFMIIMMIFFSEQFPLSTARILSQDHVVRNHLSGLRVKYLRTTKVQP